MSDAKRKSQEQFGRAADAYVTSETHAKGASLERLAELTNPQPGWRVLDVATGGGHTALTFAPHVGFVVSGDLTYNMLLKAQEHAVGARNITYCQHDAEHLPFSSRAFDLVTCRIAAHHFPDVERFVQEAVRVLRAGGILAVVDNVVSGEPQVGEYVNVFERLRDPSHVRCYTIDDWDTFLFTAGAPAYHSEIRFKPIAFTPWVNRLSVPANDIARLQVMLEQAPENVRLWMKPENTGSSVTFYIAEVLILGRKT